MDYTQFLAKTETLVLPYFGGTRVEARDRRLRLVGDADPGWWEFEVKGRKATALRRTEPADLSDLPATRGHYACGWLFFSGRERGRIALPPADEPEVLAPCTARRWHSGHLLLDTVEFEDEAEDNARRALQQGDSLTDVKGVSPGLRAAFAHALLAVAGRAVSAPVSPRETATHVRAVADGGRPAADRIVTAIRERRQEWAQRLAEQRRDQHLVDAARRAWPRNIRNTSTADLLDEALEAAGARLLGWRRVGQLDVEVTFEFMDERFISVVDARSLHVYDSGICLAGADEQLTLESLPSAIREAIETDQLHITRR